MRPASSRLAVPGRGRLARRAGAALLIVLITACGGGGGGGGGAAPTQPAPPAPSSSVSAGAPSPQRPALASPATAPSPSSAPAAQATPGPSGGNEQTYEIQAGDTMLGIADKFYGDQTQWRRIYDANRDTIGPNPDALKVGTSIKIPPKEG